MHSDLAFRKAARFREAEPIVAATVQVAFCMDTEGPCEDPDNRELLGTWTEVDRAMDRLFDDSFRQRYPDSRGEGLRVGWFFLTWTGFRTNPRNRDLGYHRVRDHYLQRWTEQMKRFGDEECWHYHQPAASGVGNEWGLDWSASQEYDQILSRQILERDWFPSCYRAGGTIMDSVSSRWVDSWFPIDFSNRAPLSVPDLLNWTGGVADWRIYHPSAEDYRREGGGRRKMARSLDLVSRFYSITEGDIEAAFKRASQGKPALLSCFDHDYRDIADRVAHFQEVLSTVSQRYPEVQWRYSAPADAVRRFLGVPPVQRLKVSAVRGQRGVHIWSTAPLFQPIPWLCIRKPDGSVEHVEQGVVRLDDTRWTWSDADGVEWVDLAVAGSTDAGQSASCKLARDRKVGQLSEEKIGRHPAKPRSVWDHSKLFPELCAVRSTKQAPEMDSLSQAAAILAPRISRGMSLLDVGCGAGHGWHSFKTLGLEYHGIDKCDTAIEIGRSCMQEDGLGADRLMATDIEELDPDLRFDAVVCLNTLSYQPMFHLPLEVLARACRRWLLVRSSFGDRQEIRYLPDALLEPGFQSIRAYFNVYARSDVETFLQAEGFSVEWIQDVREQTRFGGTAERVGGIEIPAEFMLAERVHAAPTEEEVLGEEFSQIALRWRENRPPLEENC